MMHRAGFDCSKSLSIDFLLRKNSGTGVRVNADAGGRSSDSQRFPWNERPAGRLRRTIASIGQAFGQADRPGDGRQGEASPQQRQGL